MTEVVIEKLVARGLGLGRKEGKVLMVPYSAPGDRLMVDIVEDKKGYSRGEIREILEPSENRQQPFCPYYQNCGGCDLQHIRYDAQKELKVDVLKDIFQRTAKIPLDKVNLLSDDDKGYRQRVQFQQDKQGQIGFCKASSHEVVPLHFCPLLAPALNRFLQDRPSLPKESRIPVFGRDKKYYYQAEETIELTLLGKSIRFNSDCFFQSNYHLLEAFVQEVTHQEEGDLFLDLYGGVGLFSVFLQDSFQRGHLVESFAPSRHWAEKNLSDSIQIHGHSVEHWKIPKGEKADLAVIDPPRTGIQPGARKRIMQWQPKRIVYVSCDPVTQARDVKDFLAGGYQIQRVSLVDLYPHSSHMESVIKLSL